MKIEHLKHIKGLNTIRAIAALGVLVHHVELYKHRDGISSLFRNVYFSTLIETLGASMVHLFFVLSGFLITYLLLLEQKKNGSISIKQFYFRRVFRIWPLYFVILFISFAIIPYFIYGSSFFDNSTHYYHLINTSNYSQAFPLYFLFLSNLALSKGLIIVGASQSWSVSVEEQFYLIWPWIFFIFRKHLALVLSAFIILKVFLVKLSISYLSILGVLPLEYMCLGALVGYIAFQQPKSIVWIFKLKYSFYFSLVIALIVLFFKFQLIQGSFFAILIGIIYFNQTRIKDVKIFNFLGSISYGIYMYHPIMMYFSFEIVNRYIDASLNLGFYNIAVYLLVLLSTVLISQLSYAYIESPILKLKNKFNRI